MLCLVSTQHPIFLYKSKRTIVTNKIDERIYNVYLINLIKRMILENPILRPTASEALDEINKIEKYIKEPTPENEAKVNDITS